MSDGKIYPIMIMQQSLSLFANTCYMLFLLSMLVAVKYKNTELSPRNLACLLHL